MIKAFYKLETGVLDTIDLPDELFSAGKRVLSGEFNEMRWTPHSPERYNPKFLCCGWLIHLHWTHNFIEVPRLLYPGWASFQIGRDWLILEPLITKEEKERWYSQ